MKIYCYQDCNYNPEQLEAACLVASWSPLYLGAACKQDSFPDGCIAHVYFSEELDAAGKSELDTIMEGL